MGICKIATGLREEGIKLLEIAVKNEVSNYAYHSALLNLALHTDDQEHSLSLFKKLYDSTFKESNENQDEILKIRAISLYNQAQIYLKQNDVPATLEVIESGMSQTSLSDSLYFIYLKCIITNEDKFELKAKLVNTIIKNNLVFDEDKSNVVAFDTNKLYKYLDILYDTENLAFFNSLLEYSVSKLFFKLDKNQIIYKAAISSISNKEKFFEYLLESKHELDDEVVLDSYKNLTLLNNKEPKSYTEYFNKYLKYFIKNNKINSDDIYLFALEIKIQSDLFKIDKGLELCDIIRTKWSSSNEENLKFEFLIIYYWYATLYFSKNDRFNAIKYSADALDLIDNSARKKTSMIDEKGLGAIKSQLLQIKKSSELSIPVVSTKKYGRNDKIRVRYKDGTVIEKKYKLLEADILAERCEIL